MASFVDLEKRVVAGQLANLYLIYGIEAYLQKEALALLRRALLEPEAEAFNYNEVSVSSVGMLEVVAQAEQYPMFGAHRMIVVRDFDKVDESDLEVLKSYLKSPQPTTTLVFQAESIDKRRNVTAALMKTCEVYEMCMLKEREAAEWASTYACRSGYTLSPAVAGLLVAMTGVDLYIVRNEVEKLMALLGRPGLISAEHVEQLVPRSREHSNFELVDALVACEQKRTLRLAIRLLTDGVEPLMLLAIVARTLRQILLARELMAVHLSAADIAREIGVPPFKIADFLTGARKWESSKVEWGLRRAAEVDDAIKNSVGSPELHMEFYLCELFA